MKKLPIIFLGALAAAAVGCDDDSQIGTTMVEDQVSVTVDSSFTVTGTTEDIGKVQSRTINQLIGRIDADGYGRLSSDVVTQFMPASQLDTANITLDGIDSLVLIMEVASGEYIGDPTAPLGLDIYKLDKLLPSPIYSDFNPTDYYNPDSLLATKIYNTNFGSDDDYFDIRVPLPLELAHSLYAKYESDPSIFTSPTAFASFFPGFYIKNSFGSGRLARVTATLMAMYYHNTYTTDEGTDSIVTSQGNYFAVTPEIISNNNISFEVSPQIRSRVESGEKIVMAPVGMQVKIKFPAEEIIASYNANTDPVKVLNTLSFTVPGEYIENDFGIGVPNYLLLVLESKMDEFFADNTLPDSKTSFYATYDSSTGLYDFGEMRQYILDLIDKGEVTEDDCTFIITPVAATFETTQNYYYYYYGTTQTLSMLNPYVASPVMARLDLDNAQIKLTFSSQSLK